MNKKNNNNSIVSTIEGFARMLRKSYTNVQSTISGRKLTDRVSIPIVYIHTLTYTHTDPDKRIHHINH